MIEDDGRHSDYTGWPGIQVPCDDKRQTYACVCILHYSLSVSVCLSVLHIVCLFTAILANKRVHYAA